MQLSRSRGEKGTTNTLLQFGRGTIMDYQQNHQIYCCQLLHQQVFAFVIILSDTMGMHFYNFFSYC